MVEFVNELLITFETGDVFNGVVSVIRAEVVEYGFNGAFECVVTIRVGEWTVSTEVSTQICSIYLNSKLGSILYNQSPAL